jgi:hypothetical protein
MTAMQLVTADGSVYAGEQALPRIFAGLRRWRSFARVLSLPPISLISPAIYRFIARHRRTFSVLIAHKPPASCPVDQTR